MISDITLTNVKGISGSFTLAPVTVLTGPSRSGKTALLHAVQLALLGYVPSLGKQASSTYALASGALMAVTADGRTMSWRQGAKSVECKLPPDFKEAPVAMIDLKEFFSKTAANRMTAIVAAGAGATDWKPGDLDAAIKDAAPNLVVDTSKIVAADAISYIDGWAALLTKERTGTAATLREAEAAISRLTSQLTPENVVVFKEADLRAAEAGYAAASQGLAVAENQAGERDRLVREIAAVAPRPAEEIQADIDDLVREMPAAVTGVTGEMKAGVTKLAGKVGEARAKQAVLKDRLKMLDAPTCPTCAHPITALDLESLKAEIAKAGEVLNAAIDAHKAAAAELSKTESQFTSTNNAIATAQREIDKFKLELKAAGEAEKQLASMKARLEAIPTDASLDAKRADIAALGGKVQTLRDTQKKFVAQTAIRNQVRDAEASKGKIMAKAEEVKLAIAAVTEARVKLVNDTINPMLAVANRVVTAVLGKPLTWVDDDFKVGPATMGTLSGAERMIVYAGLQIALSANYPSKIVLMDEMGNISNDLKAPLLQLIVELVDAGVISQFIGCDVTALPTDHPNVVRINFPVA